MLSSGSVDTRGAVGVGWCSTGGVDIGCGPTHGVLVSRGVTQNSTNTYYLAIGIPRKVISRKGNKMRLRKRRTNYRKGGGKSRCVGMRMFFTAHIVIHILPYTGYSIRPLEPPGYR